MKNIKTMLDLIKIVFGKYADRPAIFVNNTIYSYAQLFNKATLLAYFLQQKKSLQCAIFCKKSISAYAGIVAAILANKTYVPLNPKSPIKKNEFILKQASVGILVLDKYCEQYARQLLPNIKKPMLVILPEHDSLPSWTKLLKQHCFICTAEIKQAIKPSKIALVSSNKNVYMLFTSGSTGLAKSVIITHKNLLSYISNIVSRFAFVTDDRFSQIVDLTFDPAMHDMFVCWAVGACLYIVDDNNFIDLPKFINDYKITIITSPPSLIGFLADKHKNNKPNFPTLRYSIFGGEVLSQYLANLWHGFAPNSIIENHYGATETTIAVTAHRWLEYKQEKSISLPIGLPFANHDIAIVDKNLALVKAGIIGELCVAGPQIANGYWRNKVSTDKSFINLPAMKSQGFKWYKTGDLVLWDERLGLIYKGRVDHQIKLRGFRLERLEIEATIKSIIDSDSVAVIPWHEPKTNIVAALIAFIACKNQSDTEIKTLLKCKAPYYYNPLFIVTLNKIPHNNNQKIDYIKLQKLTNIMHKIYVVAN